MRHHRLKLCVAISLVNPSIILQDVMTLSGLFRRESAIVDARPSLGC